MIQTRLNLLDDCFPNIDREDAPWSIHLELQVEGQIEVERLERAVRHAMLTHPIARARLLPYGATSTRYEWEIGKEIDELPLGVIRIRSLADLDVERERLLGESLALDQAPPFRIVLAQCPDGDRLLIHLHHALADGLSTLRLLNSIVRHYAGMPDPVPSFDPLSVRDLKALAGSRTIPERLQRIRILLQHLAASAREPVRVHAQGGGGRGYGCLLLPLGKEDSARFLARRVKPATINDMLLTAMFLSILQWNRQHERAPGRVTALMPVNLRPRDWWHEVMGNFSSYVSVQLLPKQQDNFRQALAAVFAQTEQLKRAGAAGVLIDVLDVPKFLPAILKARLKELTPTLGRHLVESTWLSNLGRIESLPDMGRAGRVKSIYFSPPAPMPMGVSAGIASFDEQLFIGLRYNRQRFDARAAGEFAGLLRQTLLGA